MLLDRLWFAPIFDDNRTLKLRLKEIRLHDERAKNSKEIEQVNKTFYDVLPCHTPTGT